MKVVINNCHGGFGLSPKAIKRLAELNGKKAYFFKQLFTRDYKRAGYEKITMKQAKEELMFYAFSIPNPNEYFGTEKDWHEMTDEERRQSNERWDDVTLRDSFDKEGRPDPLLLQVVEELGKEASGQFSALKIVEVPDGVEYEIEEYDGREWIAEVHRTWS